MNANEILNEYLNLNLEEKIKFKRLMYNYDKLEYLEKRKELANTFINNLVDKNGEPYLNSDWVKKNLLRM